MNGIISEAERKQRIIDLEERLDTMSERLEDSKRATQELEHRYKAAVVRVRAMREMETW